MVNVVVIGAGSTGAAVAHDLALRGVKVTVIERGGVASGTTGHNQAQLHSGARYAVTDPISARHCIAENRILRRIMPGAMELNGGLFVGTEEAHLEYKSRFMECCASCGIPVEDIPTERALAIEPKLNPDLLAAIEIPDGVFDPYRFCLSFLATAVKNGASVRTFTEVVGIDLDAREVRARDLSTGKVSDLPADCVINATGPWADRTAQLAGGHVEVEASAGVMVTVGQRLCNMVLNLLAPPDDGDIIVPQRETSILGTTSWTVEDPDDIPIPEDHVHRILNVAGQMVPEVDHAPIRGVMAAARPLVVVEGRSGRETTRDFRCIDHARDGADGLVSVVGGKTTTARAMAEQASDLVCKKLGVDAECRTAVEPLVSYRAGI